MIDAFILPAEYSFANNVLTLSAAIGNPQKLEIQGVMSSDGDPATEYIKYTLRNFSGSEILLPTEGVETVDFFMKDAYAGDNDYDAQTDNHALSVISKNTNTNRYYVGAGFDYGYGHTPVKLEIHMHRKYADMQIEHIYYRIDSFYGNMTALPTSFDDITYLKFTTEANKHKLFYNTNSKRLFFLKNAAGGALSYSARHHSYEGLSKGGEEFEIVKQVDGIFATTCGLGESFGTLESFDGRSWTWYFLQYCN